MKNVAVIMAGGKGTRFWPMSKNSMPKQFLKLIDNTDTMIQLTVKRVKKLVNNEDIYILTNEMYESIISEQLPNIPKQNILFEPCSRNTAPCIALATAVIEKRYGDANVIVLPSDHSILNEDEYIKQLDDAIECAQNNNIVTLGILPNRIETGYGYIKKDVKSFNKNGVYKVERFVEKPNYEVAKMYYESKEYLWNSGMFIYKNSIMNKSLEKYLNDIHKKSKSIGETVDTEQFDNTLKEIFPTMESISIDYGVMEKADNIYTIQSEFEWDDVGSWLAIERYQQRDSENNIINGNIEVVDSNNNTIINNKKNCLIGAVGVENLVIINTEDSILIMNKDKADGIKDLITNMKKDNSQYL